MLQNELENIRGNSKMYRHSPVYHTEIIVKLNGLNAIDSVDIQFLIHNLNLFLR